MKRGIDMERREEEKLEEIAEIAAKIQRKEAD
jgi:hypothetical protein